MICSMAVFLQTDESTLHNNILLMLRRLSKLPKALRRSIKADQRFPAQTARERQVYPRQGQPAMLHTRRHNLPSTLQRLQQQRAPRWTLTTSPAQLQHSMRSGTRTSSLTERTAARRSWRQLLQLASNGHVSSGQQFRHDHDMGASCNVEELGVQTY